MKAGRKTQGRQILPEDMLARKGVAEGRHENILQSPRETGTFGVERVTECSAGLILELGRESGNLMAEDRLGC
jgi:hypothetical protein